MARCCMALCPRSLQSRRRTAGAGRPARRSLLHRGRCPPTCVPQRGAAPRPLFQGKHVPRPPPPHKTQPLHPCSQLIVVCGIGIAVMEKKEPVQRPIFIYDAVRRPPRPIFVATPCGAVPGLARCVTAHRALKQRLWAASSSRARALRARQAAAARLTAPSGPLLTRRPAPSPRPAALSARRLAA